MGQQQVGPPALPPTDCDSSSQRDSPWEPPTLRPAAPRSLEAGVVLRKASGSCTVDLETLKERLLLLGAGGPGGKPAGAPGHLRASLASHRLRSPAPVCSTAHLERPSWLCQGCSFS